ncbi:hypothetical protein OAN22_02345 [Alphaproteobacteria bacterium]|nr:hypothetical protein [Alphaproteobacteria bacterium]
MLLDGGAVAQPTSYKVVRWATMVSIPKASFVGIRKWTEYAVSFDLIGKEKEKLMQFWVNITLTPAQDVLLNGIQRSLET